jgi:hypothetical protein
MEDTINIAGVNCKVSKLATLDYETLFRLAINNVRWKGVKNREVYIKKELKEHGYKPTTEQTKTNKPTKRKRAVSRGNKKKS